MQLAYSIEDTMQATRLGKTKIYALIKEGRLTARKIDKRTVILKDDLERFLSSSEHYPTQNSVE